MAPLIFTELTTVGELRQDPVIGPLFPYLIWDPTGTGGGNLADDSATLADIQKKTPTWGACDMAYGLNALRSAAELLEREPGGVLLPVYSEQEMSEDPGKCPVRFIHFPARLRGLPGDSVVHCSDVRIPVGEGVLGDRSYTWA